MDEILGNCQQTGMVGAKGMCVKMVGVEPEEKQEACHHRRCIERIGSCHEGQGEPRWDFWQRITCTNFCLRARSVEKSGTSCWETGKMSQIRNKGHQRGEGCVRAVKELQPKGLGCCLDREVGERDKDGGLGDWGVGQPSLQGIPKGCSQRVVEEHTGCAQFGHAELEGPNGSPQ